MPPVFVTSSAGHVGANLVRRLLDEGVWVRVLLRHEDNNEGLEGLEVERAFGDIRDLDDIRRAITGCQGVYHCAAYVSTVVKPPPVRRSGSIAGSNGGLCLRRFGREVAAGGVKRPFAHWRAVAAPAVKHGPNHFVAAGH